MLSAVQIYPIPEALSDTHDGEEWALAVILGKRAVALRYLSDIAPPIVFDQVDGLSAEASIQQWLCNRPLELRELQAFGAVSVGMVSAAGFVELWAVSH